MITTLSCAKVPDLRPYPELKLKFTNSASPLAIETKRIKYYGKHRSLTGLFSGLIPQRSLIKSGEALLYFLTTRSGELLYHYLNQPVIVKDSSTFTEKQSFHARKTFASWSLSDPSRYARSTFGISVLGYSTFIRREWPRLTITKI